MKRIHKMFALLALVLALCLCGCSAQDVTLPTQLDMLPGESIALAELAQYDGPEVDAEQSLALLAQAQTQSGVMGFAFTSSEPWVADVDEMGVLTAYYVGDTTVTVSCEALEYYAEMQVHVAQFPTYLTVTPTMQLDVGDAAYLYTETDSTETVVYLSSDTSVATVDADGLVTAVDDGEAVITVTVGGSSLTGSCVVTVGDMTQSLSLSRSETELLVGERLRLVADTQPELPVAAAPRWRSSDERVVTVKDGIVTAVGGGKARVTAMLDGKTASCLVTVTDPYATPETATPETAAEEPESENAAEPQDTAANQEAADAAQETAALTEAETATPETAATEEPTAEPAAEPTPEPTAEPEDPLVAAAQQFDDYLNDLPETETEIETAATPESAEATEPETEPEAPEGTHSPALTLMGPGPALMPEATPETATPESATPESAATPETAMTTPETAAATASPETAASPESASPESAAPEPTPTPEPAPGLLDQIGSFFSGLGQSIGNFFGFN